MTMTLKRYLPYDTCGGRAKEIHLLLRRLPELAYLKKDISVRRFPPLLLVLVLLWVSRGWAQTPTLVQHVSCPNSGELGSGIGGSMSSAPVYQCPLPEPAQAGNAIVLGLFSDNSGSPRWTVSDDMSNSWSLAGSTTDSSGNIVAVYYALNVAAGTRMLSVKNSGGTNGYIAVSASEYYNVATTSALDGQSCNAGASSKSISAGSITPGSSGDLLWQWAADANSAVVASFAAGSQSSITWQLNGTDINASDATQAGVYNSTSAINPTFASGTAAPFDSCVIALKAASAGNAPGRSFRIVHMLHAEMNSTSASSYAVQMPTSGNLFVISFSSGGNTISSITGSPSNTWTSTGGPTNPDNQTYYPDQQMYYSANATPSNTMTLNIGQTGALTGTTYMIYDFAGAATSPFDVDSGGQEGDQGSEVTQLTSCAGCLNPSSANEVILGNVGQDWCTATSILSPSGALFDSAIYSGNSVNGPEPVDQNNGWFHYYDPGTGALTATWSYTCGSYAQAGWSGRLAAFKGASGIQPAPPTGVQAAPVAQ